MNRTSEDVEREVESARGDLDRTVEALKDKMTPGQLIDEISRSFRSGGAGDMLGNLGGQVRDNPMAVAMIGAGVAWLMMSKGDHAYANSSARTDEGAGPEAHRSLLGDSAAATGDIAHKVGDAAAEAKAAVSGAAEHAIHGLQDLRDHAGDATRKTRKSLDDILAQEPLVIGALGLAVGVALGAAFPSTPLEGRTFGAARDDLINKGGEKLAAAAKGMRATGEAVVGAMDASAKQGTSSSGDLVDKAEGAVRAGVDALRDQLGRPHQPT